MNAEALNKNKLECVRAFSLAAGGLEADGHLEGVVDIPLETGEGADHDNSGTDTVPQTLEADVSVDVSNLLSHRGVARLLVEDGDHGVSGLGHDSAENTGKVPGGKDDRELSSLRVGLLRVSENVAIECTHDVLESAELDHGVGHLAHPQGTKSLIETVPALVGLDGVEALKESWSEVGSLHSDLDL